MSSASSSRKRGLDEWLQQHGKNLRTGDQLQLRLVKGNNGIQICPDPVDEKAEPEKFPAILKFPLSTAAPDFSQPPWNTARLYQQDVPKPEDSDDEQILQQQALRRRRRRVYATPRQWILQENVEFLESMLQRRENRSSSNDQQQQSSTRYEGGPEHNPSHFVLMSLTSSSTDDPIVNVQPLPTPNATLAFSQPVRSGGGTILNSLSQADEAAYDATSRLQKKKPAVSRLLAKLTSNEDDVDEGDDVMADVKFSHRKGGGGARKELLTSMADGIAVSNDGVLGGTNDAAFGSRGQRFGKMQSSETAGNAVGGPTTERGADGAAMADDFYSRDVGKEFEEMDYDPNEGEFDDDDVDVGESEIHDIGNDGGDEIEEEDDDEEDADLGEDVAEGAAGLASTKGFKMLLAKARGEAPVEPVETPNDGNNNPQNRTNSPAPENARDHRTKLWNATQVRKKSPVDNSKSDPTPAALDAAASSMMAPTSAPVEAQVDENGLRIIDLESVRREIWLNHGTIVLQRLGTIFGISKKVPNKKERQKKFKEVIRELCTINQDPINGSVLILKQHYSHMD